MLHTTFRLLQEAGACKDRYSLFRRAMKGRGYTEDRQPIPLTEAMESNGLDDALWALRAVPAEDMAARDMVARLFAADCAERALPLYEKVFPQDDRPRQTILIARRYAFGLVGSAARAAAWDAARAAAWDAARAAAGAAAWEAAESAAEAAAWAAARSAAGAAAWAAAREAAWAAARAATWEAAWDAERAWQAKHLRAWLEEPDRLITEARAALALAEGDAAERAEVQP